MKKPPAMDCLVASDALFEAVLNAIPDVIGIQDTAHRILRYNEAGYRFLKLRPEDCNGKFCWELVGRATPCEACACKEVLRTGLPSQVVRFDAELGMWLDMRAYPIRDDTGQLRYVVEHLRDVTRERHFESEMVETQKLESLGLMASGVAHDFNNILSAIMGRADLARHLSRSPSITAHLAVILDASKQAAELCRHLLTYAGKGEREPEPVSLGTLISEMRPMLVSTVEKKACCSWLLPPDLPAVLIDPNLARQLVLNLVVNASDALEGKVGHVNVELSLSHCKKGAFREAFPPSQNAAGDYLTLTVSDTGCGMDPLTRERMFEPFYTTKTSGRGLGMAAVLGVVRDAGGAIAIDSKLGSGSKITIFLPVWQGEERPPETICDGNGDPRSICRGKRILVADDEASVLETAVCILQRAGMIVERCSNGQEACDRFAADPEGFDCVLLDLTMPVLGGAQACRAMRKLRAVPILFMSGYDFDRLGGKLASCPSVRLIEKPFDVRTLLTAVARALQEGAFGEGDDTADASRS